MKYGTTGELYIDPATGKTDFAQLRSLGFSYEDYQPLADTKGELYYLDEEAFRKELRRQKQEANAAGIAFFQAHGPWPVDDTTPEKREANMEHFKRCIRGCYYLECPNLVVHPMMPEGWQQELDGEQAVALNREFIRELAQYAKPYGVTVCVENMPFGHQRLARTEALVQLVRELGQENLGICLDTGHCNVLGEDAGDCARLCGNLLKTVHIHDNSGKEDEHLIPYLGSVNWESFQRSLEEIGFEGVWSLECSCRRYPGQLRKELGALAARSLSVLAGG